MNSLFVDSAVKVIKSIKKYHIEDIPVHLKSMIHIIRDFASDEKKYANDIVKISGIKQMQILDKMGKLNTSSYTYILNNAVRYNRLDIIKFCAKKLSRPFNSIMHYAAYYGNIDVMKYCIANGADNIDKVMSDAAKNGHLDIIEICIKHGAKDFNEPMECASVNGEIDIIKICIEHGADSFDDSIKYAALYNRLDTIKYFMQFEIGKINIIKIIRLAIYRGHIDLMEYCLNNKKILSLYHTLAEDPNSDNDYFRIFCSNGTPDYNNIMVFAATCDRINVVKFCIERYGASDFNRALDATDIKRSFNIAKLLIKNGANNVGKMIHVAVNSGRLDIAEFCIDTKIEQPELLMKYAAAKGDINIMKLCIKRENIVLLILMK